MSLNIELNVCWNSVICRIFHHNKWESVKSVMFWLGLSNIVHLIMLRKVSLLSLYRYLFYSSNSVLGLSDVFRIGLFFINNYSDDNMLSAVSVKASVAYERVYDRFHVQSSWSVDLFYCFRLLCFCLCIVCCFGE